MLREPCGPFATSESWTERLVSELASYFQDRVWLSLRPEGARTQLLGGELISIDLVRTFALRGWVVRVHQNRVEGLHLTDTGREALAALEGESK